MYDINHPISEQDTTVQHQIRNDTNIDWPIFIKEPRNNDMTKMASLLFTLIENVYTGFSYGEFITEYRRLLNLTNNTMKDEDYLNIANKYPLIDENDISKENLLRVIDNLIAINEFYADNGINHSSTRINRLKFLKSYISKVDFHDKVIEITSIYYDNITYTYNTTFKELMNGTIQVYTSMSKNVNKIISLKEAVNNTITIKNIGKVGIKLIDEDKYQTDVSVYIDEQEINEFSVFQGKWSNDVLLPGEETTFTLNKSCAGKNIEITSPARDIKSVCT